MLVQLRWKNYYGELCTTGNTKYDHNSLSDLCFTCQIDDNDAKVSTTCMVNLRSSYLFCVSLHRHICHNFVTLIITPSFIFFRNFNITITIISLTNIVLSLWHRLVRVTQTRSQKKQNKKRLKIHHGLLKISVKGSMKRTTHARLTTSMIEHVVDLISSHQSINDQ